MAPAWEIWALAGTAFLQLAVAYWWWRGPYLEGSRTWVSALFGLNGLGTLSKALRLTLDSRLALVDALGSVAESWTNFALFGLGLVALGVHRRRSVVPKALLGLYALFFVLYTPFEFLYVAFESPRPALPFSFQATTLSLAIIAGALGLIWRTRSAHRTEDVLWVLALAGIGFRYAELALTFSPPAEFLDQLTIASSTPVGNLGRALRLVAMAAAFGWLLLRRYREPRPARPRLYEISILLVGAGFLFGGARILSSGSDLVIYFSLGFVRPIVFLGVQSQMTETPFWETRQWSHLRTGTIVFLWVLIGLPLGHILQLTSLSSILVGLSLGVLVLGVLRTASPPPRPEEPSTTGPQEPDRDWPLEDERVALPDDWRRRVEDGYELYRSLEQSTRDEVDGLARWQRIVLALHAAPEDSQVPPYERTTPGLHLLTHCPYASIGPEISRANERADRILDEVDLERPRTASLDIEEPLIEGSLGQAEGLSSPRVKSYELTEIGEQVARRLREELGLEDLDDADVRRLVGEGYANL